MACDMDLLKSFSLADLDQYVSRHIQSAIPSPLTEEHEGVQVACRSLPSGRAGGDFWRVLRRHDGQLALVIGDVHDHGLRGALVKAYLQGVVNVYAPLVAGPADLVRLCHRVLVRLNREWLCGGVTCSLLHGFIDVRRRRFEYCHAGHRYAFVWLGDERFRELPWTSVALGASPVGPTSETSHFLPLDELHRSFFCTNGVCSASDFEERDFRYVLEAGLSLSSEQQVAAVERYFRCKDGNAAVPREDVTLLAVDYRGLHRRAAAASSLRYCARAS